VQRDPGWRNRAVSPAEASRLVKSGDRVFVHGAAATPTELLDALCARDDLRGVELFHLHRQIPCRKTHDRSRGTRPAGRHAMAFPVRITFRDVTHSDAIETHVRRRAAELEMFSARIVGCHVVVESPHKHATKARHFRVLAELAVPGGEVVVSHAAGDDATNEDVYAAIDEAFDRLGRRLEDRVRRRRGDVKTHEGEYRAGRVSKLWSWEGFGFIEPSDGGEVYFHRNSVAQHAFDRLAIGSEVRFVEEVGEKGPQASTVNLVA